MKKFFLSVVEEIPWEVVSASSILKTRSKFLKVRTKIKSDLNFTFQEQCQGIFLEPDRTQSISCKCVLDTSNIGMVKTLDGIYILRSKCQNCVVKLAWAKRNQERLSQVKSESWPKPKDCASCKAMLTMYNCTIVESKGSFYFDSHCRSCIALEKKKKKQQNESEFLKTKVEGILKRESKKLRHNVETVFEPGKPLNSRVILEDLKCLVEEAKGQVQYRQGGQCYYCKRQTILDFVSNGCMCSIDHLHSELPHFHAGQKLQITCIMCNYMMSDKTEAERAWFLDLIRGNKLSPYQLQELNEQDENRKKQLKLEFNQMQQRQKKYSGGLVSFDFEEFFK